MAIGLFIATSVFSAVYLFGSSKDTDNGHMTSIEDATVQLESEGFVILTKDEHEKLHDEIAQLEKIVEEAYNEETEELDDDTDKNDEKDENEKEVNKDKKDKKKETSKKKEKEVQKFTLNIESGMHSRNIGEVLKKYGIVEHERDFEKYVLDLGVDRNIQIGEYELSSDMSVDKIVQIITKQ